MHHLSGRQCTELKAEWVSDKRYVGVTSGASAPEILVQEVIARLRELGSRNVRELEGIKESITFPLPKGISRA